MSSNNKPICVYQGSGLFNFFGCKSCWRAATGLWEHRYLHTGICVYLNYANNSIEVQLGKTSLCGLWKRGFFLHSVMFEQLHVFFSQILFFHSLFLSALCTVPRWYCAQILWRQTPHFWVTGMPWLRNNINEWAVRGHMCCTTLTVPSLVPFVEISSAPKHAKLRFALRKIECCFSLKEAVPVDVAAS